MSEKRMLIVPAELVRTIDENRGDMTQAEFIDFLIENQLKQRVKEREDREYVTREEILSFKEEIRLFEEDIKKLLKSFLDFFVSYGLELGKGSPKTEFEELTTKLHELENDLASDGKKGEAKIKWK